MAISVTELEADFPNLKRTGYKVKSSPTPEYNCIAFAVDIENRWWDNTRRPRTYWPEGVPDDGRIDSLQRLFELQGYTECSDHQVEIGFTKVALYATPDRQWTHAAKQLRNGRWLSKCGKGHDIEHSLRGLESAAYGTATKFLRRALETRGLLEWLSVRIIQVIARCVLGR